IQSADGSSGLEGTVRDASQAVVPGSVVAVTCLKAQIKEVAVSDVVGRYRFRELPAGMSLVEVRKSGFRVFQKQYLVPGNREKQILDILLEVGEVSESVEVVGQARAKNPAPNSVQGPPRRIRVGGNVQATRL